MSRIHKVTSGRDWRQRAEEGVVIRLPSGNVARVRGIGPDVMIRSGRIPDSLTPLIADLMDGKTVEETWKPQTVNDLKDYVEFLNLICECAMVSPRIVEHPTQDDEIGIDHLDYNDRTFLVGLVGASTQMLESFRAQQESTMESVGAPKGDGPTGQPDTSSPGVGTGEDGA